MFLNAGFIFCVCYVLLFESKCPWFGPPKIHRNNHLSSFSLLALPLFLSWARCSFKIWRTINPPVRNLWRIAVVVFLFPSTCWHSLMMTSYFFFSKGFSWCGAYASYFDVFARGIRLRSAFSSVFFARFRHRHCHSNLQMRVIKSKPQARR